MILDFQPEGAIVLTTPEPGAFLNIRWEEGDPSYYFIPRQISDISAGVLWINGLDISQDASIYNDASLGFYIYTSDSGDPSVASFYLFTTTLNNFDASLKIDVYTENTLVPGLIFDSSFGISVLNRPYIATSESINIFETSNLQIDGEASYLILRTNPKFSGNIKLIADSSNNLYLDTFKVSDILSNKLYRKQSISGDSVFSGDVRKVFSSLPLGEMYRLDAENTLNISIPKTDYSNQYNLNYSYGSRLFEDELYDEDYSILAPIWINKNLPDYFVVFRMPGVFNAETYVEGASLENLASKFFTEGQLIKSWGMKEGTVIGEYLRNHIQELNSVISPMFLSLSDPNLKDPDPNTWYGIATDKGIIAGRSETTYFFDQKSKNFTDLNAFSSGGFERLNLLCPNLINMEFAFSDYDVSLYTMQRYFGLYVTENPLYEISYYSNNPGDPVQILSLDGKDSSIFFSSSIFDVDGSIQENYKTRLFTIDDLINIKRITNVHQIDGTDLSNIEEWLNKPGDNIFSIKVKEIDNILPFVSFSILNKLSSGEHLRIVSEEDFTIWEIYGIESDILNPGESWTYATEYTENGYPTVYRTAFSINGSIEDQNNAIWKAWNIFADYNNTPFETFVKKSDGQSLKMKDWAYGKKLKFQRLTAQTVNNPEDPSSNLNSVASYSDIEFFGNLIPDSTDFEIIPAESSYGPINFEIFGDRNSITIDFFDPALYYIYSMDSSIIDIFEDKMLYLSSTDSWYRLVQFVDVSTKINRSFQYTEDPTTVLDKIIIYTERPIMTINDIWNSYAVYPLTISLMGINPVKDFDYTVYDSSLLDFKSEYWYKREGDIDTFSLSIAGGAEADIKISNSYKILSGSGLITMDGSSLVYNVSSPSSPFSFNTFDFGANIKATTDTKISYALLDGSTSFKSYKPGYSEEYLQDYYQDPSTLLKYGLVVPTVTKWQGIGNDCRNNPIRLMLDASLLDVSTNFIPYEDNFKGELFYPSFKYLSPGVRNWEDYVFFDINDSIEYYQDGSTYASFKDLMKSNTSLDIFSKLVYSNYQVDGTKLRSTIVYYNNYKNTIDAVVNGISLSFRVTESARNTLDIQDWDRFRISAIAVPSRNKDNNKTMEVFINENTQTILLVWYQGNDILNYNYRYSTTLPGKGVLDPSISAINAIQWRGFNDTDKHYSHVKTPFGVNNATLSSNIFNLYGIDVTYDGSIASPFLQTNLNYGDNLYSIFNAYDGNVLFGSGFEFYNRGYETFRQYVNYDYTTSGSTYGNLVANLAYSYMRNQNLYKDTTCSWDTLQDILTKNKIEYYIFRNNQTYRSANFSYNPVTITINEPREYNGVVTYNGWYRPKFQNILDFSYNEEKELIDIVERDFTLGNTNLRSYQNIKQLWYNKLVTNVTAYDVSSGNAIDYQENYNPFKSQWDANYYYLYSGATKTSIDGYNSSMELPSYFGSKLIKLPQELVLDSWTNTSVDEVTGNKKTTYSGTFSNSRRNKNDNIYLSYNLTRNIVSIFKNKDTFINNWSDLTQSDNIIDGYIKDTILSYYNISKSKIMVEIWTKPYKGSGSRIALTKDDSFTLWSGANVEGDLIYKNNEYIYTIAVKSSELLIYFVQFTLFEK